MTKDRSGKRSKIKNAIMIVTFGILLLSMMPTILGKFSIIQSPLMQKTEATVASPTTNTLPAQGSNEIRLPRENGFTVKLLATQACYYYSNESKRLSSSFDANEMNYWEYCIRLLLTYYRKLLC